MKNSTDKLVSKEIPEGLKAEKEEKKFMFQFVNHEDGKRSEPFVGSWTTIQEILDLRKEDERPTDQDYILLVAVLDGQETTIPATPLITVKTFKDFKHAS